MIKPGDVVKLNESFFTLNKHQDRQREWRWRIIREDFSDMTAPATYKARRLDTLQRRLGYVAKSNLTPISLWERLTKRY